MSAESELKKNGISIIEPLDEESIKSIAKSVSKKLALGFPNYGFTYDSLYERFSKLPMYIATLREGLAEASYFYKDSSVYFRDGMGLSDLEKFAVHELIHNLQERKDSKGNLVRLGLCTFKGQKARDMALNEAAVQTITSNVLDSNFESVTYYGITFSTISSNCYPIICNLIAQMAYVTGEEVLFDSTFNSNDHFKNKFCAFCGEKVYNHVSSSFDKLLDLEERLIKLSAKIKNEDLSLSKVKNISDKISDLKQQIRNIYFNAQELIIKSFFSTLLKSLISSDDIYTFRQKLYNYQDLIGTTDSYHFFNTFYIEMMENLDKKFDGITESYHPSTYLIPHKDTAFSRLIRYIKKVILKREFETDKNK